MSTLDTVWTRLSAVTALRFTSKSNTGIGWEGEGVGTVQVCEIAPDILVFDEAGQWQQRGGKAMRFTNKFRWTRRGETLRLEHLRFGVENPVSLFEMAADESGVWREISPHLCKQDCYAATLKVDDERVLLDWTVRGPTRDEAISYVYF